MNDEKLLAKLDELIIAVRQVNDQLIRHNAIQLEIESERRKSRLNPLIERGPHPFMPDKPSILDDGPSDIVALGVKNIQSM